jgi:hypothetical protein
VHEWSGAQIHRQDSDSKAEEASGRLRRRIAEVENLYGGAWGGAVGGLSSAVTATTDLRF